MFIRLTKIWIWISVVAVAGGWFLSLIKALTAPGYVGVFVVSTVGFLIWRSVSKSKPGESCRKGSLAYGREFRKLRRRLSKPLPLAFCFLTLLILIGGAIYAPNNHTALTYRIPRVLQWLAHERWIWIYTPDARMNDRACGMEWLSAPLLLFTKSDRLLFLLNFIPYLFLPGLIFSLWTRLGVRGRVAWYWMWLMPTAYAYLLQAGSIGNDTFPAFYALAAMHFAFRARVSLEPSEVWHSILAAALFTGGKASNLPLLLPWGIVMLGTMPVLRKRIVATTVMVALSAAVSFLPTALLNVKCCGDWSGAKLENTGLAVKNPLVGIWGNGFLLVLKNFLPPVFPGAGWWNRSAPALLPRAILKPMEASFEPNFHTVGEVPTEEWAGIGFGISVLVLVSVVAGKWIRNHQSAESRGRSSVSLPAWLRWSVLLAGWVALMAYCMKCGMVDAARLVAAYYPFILPIFLTGSSQVEVVERRWWQAMAWGVMGLALLVLVIAPSRPLWPARTVLANAVSRHPQSRGLGRALSVYTVYAERNDPLAAVRRLLPSDVSMIGFMGTEDDIDLSLWRPLFQKRVEYALIGDSRDQIKARKLQYIVVGGFHLKEKGVSLTDWLAKVDGKVVGKTEAIQKLAEGPQKWYVVKLN